MYKLRKSQMRLENEQLIERLVNNEKVKYLEPDDKVLFNRYKGKAYFADNVFSMLYGWGSSCRFAFHVAGNAIVTVGIGVDDEFSGSFIYEDSEDIKSCLDYLIEIIPEGKNVIIDNFCEHDISNVKDYCSAHGLTANISYEENFSDYVYLLDKYLSLDGKANKSKRGSMNWLKRNYPNIRHVAYCSELKKDVLSIFSQWCRLHDCEMCIFGCEYAAIDRLLDVYDEEVNLCSVVYINNRPVAFSLCERINEDTVACLMQKTSHPARGLAFYASWCLQECYGNVKYIDLCEDMGIEGLREDKQSLHPVKMVPKYRIVIS